MDLSSLFRIEPVCEMSNMLAVSTPSSCSGSRSLVLASVILAVGWLVEVADQWQT